MDTYSHFALKYLQNIGRPAVYRRIKEHTEGILALLIENGRFIYQPLK